MNRINRIFVVASVAMLVVLAIAPVKDLLREWTFVQRAYNSAIALLPVRVPQAETGLHQIWARKLGRVDRCVTCHLGIMQPALAHAKQPFRTHPTIPHDIDDFGCTICHDGQGAATTFRDAIGDTPFWERPILPQPFVESSCGRCHREAIVPQAPVLTRGRTLIAQYNCSGCHTLSETGKGWAPALTGIGAKVSRGWLVSWLRRPKDYWDHTRMPMFHLKDDDVQVLADFLMTFKSFAGGVRLDSGAPQSTDPKLIEEGKTVISEARCVTCHTIGGRGGSVAVELNAVAKKVTPQWLDAYLENPKRMQPGVMMPQYRFTPHQRAAVVAFIESEYVSGDFPDSAHTPDPAFYAKGLELFHKYNCNGCHSLEGPARGGESGPDLTTIGSKHLYEIDFGTTDIAHNLPSYLVTKLKHPRIFGSTMRMPDFELADSDARAIAVALLANTSEPIPAEMKIMPAVSRPFVPQGKFGKLVNELACLACHTMNGSGHLIATDLSTEGSQAQPAWMVKYFGVPYSLRPILPERMPNLFLPDSDKAALASYLGTVCVADSLEHAIPIDADRIAKGKMMYFERYGCQACHQIGGAGGFVGAALDHIGARLKPGWIYSWLKKPQAFKPESIEPDNKLSDADAEALTAYLLSL